MAAATPQRLVGGHTGTVLTIAVTYAPNVRLLSGAEAAELALWSVDGVNCHKWSIADTTDDVTSIACSKLASDTVYVACGTKIYNYDLRNLANYVCMYDFNEDEINEITLNEKENYLAAAEDSNNIKIFNLAEGKVFKTLRKHTNICSAVQFRPRRQWELLSGGYDSKLIQWDFGKSRAYCIIDMQEMGGIPDNRQSYLVNPPFVHSIAVSSTGNTVAVGTENALVQVFDAERRTLQLRSTLRAHTRGVSQVHCPLFADDRFIVSGGNDCRVCVWDTQAGEHALVVSNGCAASAVAADQPVSAALRPVHETVHSEKINWLTSAESPSRKLIVVSDNTPNPILFPFPE